MPNKNYQKGRRKEYKICEHYRSLGYDIVQRTAGSHSPIDVFAINKKLKEIIWIQAKPDNFSDNATKKLYIENGWLDGIYRSSFIVI